MSRSALLVLMLLVGLGSMLFLSDRKLIDESKTTPDRAPVASHQEESGADIKGTRREVLVSETRDERAQRRAREVLADYWGSRWPEREKALLEAGLDLDQPLEIPPWESVADSIEKSFHLSEESRARIEQGMLDWPSKGTEDDLAKGLQSRFEFERPLSPEDFSAVQALASPYNSRLSSLSAEYVEGLDQSLYQCWVTGDFVKAPFSSAGLGDDGGFYTVAGACDAWAFSVSLLREEYPYLMSLKGQAHELTHQRDGEVTRYLGDQGYIHVRTSLPTSDR